MILIPHVTKRDQKTRINENIILRHFPVH
jgi:hypothetical protein